VLPERLIYTHLPRDPKWQLIRTPIDQNQFMMLPRLRPEFFAHGIRLSDGSTGVLRPIFESVLECCVA